MASGSSPEQELNLVPYLDIMVNLTLFMLVITASIVDLREVAVLPPSYAHLPAPAAERAPTQLVVVVTAAGLGVWGTGDSEIPTVNVPLLNGQHDFGRLTAVLREYHDHYPVSDRLMIVPEPQVAHRDVVAVLDAARADAAGPLFPDTTLAIAVASR